MIWFKQQAARIDRHQDNEYLPCYHRPTPPIGEFSSSLGLLAIVSTDRTVTRKISLHINTHNRSSIKIRSLPHLDDLRYHTEYKMTLNQRKTLSVKS